MAARRILSHSVAGGDLGYELRVNGIQYYTWAEAIGPDGQTVTYWPGGTRSAGPSPRLPRKPRVMIGAISPSSNRR